MSNKASSFAHPLDPLSVDEIKQTVSALRAYVEKGAQAPKPIEKILFNSIDLREPNKYAVLLWRGLFSAEEVKEVGGDPKTPLLRQAEVSLGP
jgi:Cu2+-containing amine oxidase